MMSQKITFHNDFTEGWSFAVPKAFRAALDLKPVKNKENAWAIGHRLAFKEGDLIWDIPTRTGHTWGELLLHIKIGVQVNTATPAQWKKDEDKKIILPGRIVATIYKPTKDRSKVEDCGVIRCTQIEFVKMLKDGIHEDLIT